MYNTFIAKSNYKSAWNIQYIYSNMKLKTRMKCTIYLMQNEIRKKHEMNNSFIAK